MEIAQILTAAAALIGALVSVVNLATSLRNGRRLKNVEIHTDGLTAALVKETRTGALAEGKQQQKDATAVAEGVAAIQTLKDQKPGVQ